jgi:hypothetical protein
MRCLRLKSVRLLKAGSRYTDLWSRQYQPPGRANSMLLEGLICYLLKLILLLLHIMFVDFEVRVSAKVSK